MGSGVMNGDPRSLSERAFAYDRFGEVPPGRGRRRSSGAFTSPLGIQHDLFSQPRRASLNRHQNSSR